MFNPRIVQDGGAYISTIDASIVNVSSQALSGLNLSTLEYLMKLGNIPTADLLLTATLPQISAFIRTVEGNITADNNTIQLNTISISHFISTIHKPGGLQDTYNTLSTNYTSSINAYVNQSNLIYMQNQNYANDTSTLRTQYEISTMHASTLLSYTQQYSYAMSSLSTQEITIKHLEKIYQTNILNMSTSIFLYNATQREMQNISTVIAGDVASLKTPGLTQEVIKAYSTSYLQNTALYSTLTNVLNNYNFSTQYFNQERMNTFAYLSTVYKVTQFNTLGMEQYTDTIRYYQQQQAGANGTVTALSYELSTIKISIASLENEINVVIPGQFQSDVHTILSTGKQYYTYLDNDIDLLCNEYIGGLQTYNSKIGYALGSLGVAINTNVKEINRSILTVNAGGAAVLTAQQIQMFADDNIEMNKIISTLNTFDTNFTEIIGNITDERTLLHSFVQTRQNTFVNYDVPAIGLTGPTNAAAAYTYVSSFIKMNQILNTVNPMITKRIDDVLAITAKITPLKSDINRYFRKYLGAQMTDDQIPAAIMSMNDVNGNPLGPTPIGLEEYMIPQSQFYDYIPTNPLFLFSPLTGIQGGVPNIWLNPSDTFTINGNVISNRVGGTSATMYGVSTISINNAVLSGVTTSGNTLTALKFGTGSSLVSNTNITLSATVTTFIVGSISASAAPFAKVFSFTGTNKFYPVLQYKVNLLQNYVTSLVPSASNKYGNLTSKYGNNLAMFESIYANGAIAFALNGNPTSPNTAVATPALGATGYTFGGGAGLTAFHGIVCEILVFDTVLSAADTAIIEGYLAWKWGLVDSLPSTHAYKTGFNYSKLVQYPVIPTVVTSGYTLPLVPSIAMFDGGSPLIWLDANNPGTISGQIVDRSGKGNNGTLVNVVISSIGNGLNALPLNGTNGYIYGATPITNASKLTTFVVLINKRSNPVNNWARIVSFWNGSSANDYENDTSLVSLQLVNSPNICSYKNRSASPQIAAPTLNTISILYSSYGDSLMSVGINGTISSKNPANTTGITIAKYFIGCGPAGPNAWESMTGSICEVLVFPYVMTDAQRQQVEVYLASKWGTLSNLNQYGDPATIS